MIGVPRNSDKSYSYSQVAILGDSTISGGEYPEGGVRTGGRRKKYL